MELRSPLSRVLGSGSAKEGTDHWWGQRLSAVALLVLGLWFILALTTLGSFDYLDVVRWAGHPSNSVMLILLSLTLAYHSDLGIQVIIEDYVHGSFVKLVAVILNKFAHVFFLMTALFAILKIAFGADA